MVVLSVDFTLARLCMKTTPPDDFAEKVACGRKVSAHFTTKFVCVEEFHKCSAWYPLCEEEALRLNSCCALLHSVTTKGSP